MVRFITEEYLRDIFRKEPFDTFVLEKSQRLTPGASQFLSDKRIKLEDKNKVDFKKNDTEISEKKTDNEPAKEQNKDNQNVSVEKNNVYQPIQVSIFAENVNAKVLKKVCYKLKAIEAKFLIMAKETVEKDVILAQAIATLNKRLSDIRSSMQSSKTFEDIKVISCSGMNNENFYEDIDDCFEIGQFHMQLERGMEILKLNELKCELRQVLPLIDELYEGNNEVYGIKVTKNINAIINLLSQLMCSAMGGTKCQRTM